MLNDEHTLSLEAAMRDGALDGVRELTLNWNPHLTKLPSLTGLRLLRKLSLAGCDGLTKVPRVRRDVVVIRPAHLSTHTKYEEPHAW